MKRTLFIPALLMLFSLISYGQAGGSGFGLKAGINFNSNGDLKINEVPEINPDAGVGFHVGVWGRLGGVAYVRPELVYTEINSEYEGENFDMRKLKMRKLDLPVLFGHRFLGIFHGFIGPAFQYILNTDLEDLNISDVEKEFSVGLHIGGGVNLGKIGIDIRYERGLSPNYL
ncbi:MAG: porin family protein, partial [Robiginitalea sp.]